MGGMLPRDGAARTHATKDGEPLAGRKGVPDAGESFGVSSTRLAPGVKENSSDPKMICTITHHTILIKCIRVRHRHGGCGTQWGPVCPVLVP